MRLWSFFLLCTGYYLMLLQSAVHWLGFICIYFPSELKPQISGSFSQGRLCLFKSILLQFLLKDPYEHCLF